MRLLKYLLILVLCAGLALLTGFIGIIYLLGFAVSIAEEGETQDQIERKLFFVRKRPFDSNSRDEPLWTDDQADGLLVDEVGTYIMEYCILGGCIHVSYDSDGKKIHAIATYDD